MKERERERESVYAAACAPLPCRPYTAALCEVLLVLAHTSAWQTSWKPSSCRHPLFYIEATKKCNIRWNFWSTHWLQQREAFPTAWSGWIATAQQSQWNNQDNNSNLLLIMTHTHTCVRTHTHAHTCAHTHTAVGVFGNACLYYPGQKKKRTIIEIRGEKNAVPRVTSSSIRAGQVRSATVRDFCPALIAPDRAWYHTWNSVLLAANLGDGSFFVQGSISWWSSWVSVRSVCFVNSEDCHSEFHHRSSKTYASAPSGSNSKEIQRDRPPLEYETQFRENLPALLSAGCWSRDERWLASSWSQGT